jgi:hypothetical protein
MTAKTQTTTSKRSNLGKPRIADYCDPEQKEEWFPINMIKDWFDYALPADSAKPTVSTYEKLARELRVTFNRMSNKEKQKRGPVDLSELKDVDPREWFEEKLKPLLNAAYDVILAARAFEEFGGNHHWVDDRGSISLEDVVQMMHRIGARARAAKMSRSGRPREAWHAAARAISPLIKRALEEAGHVRNLSAADEKSHVAIIGAQAINRAYRIEIEAGAFASAMRNRERSKKAQKEKNFFDWFPEARRIGIP